MNLAALTNKEIFTLCHSTARKVTAKLGGNYHANFTFALREIYSDIKAARAAAKPASIKVKSDFLASDMLINRRIYSSWEQGFILSVAGHKNFSQKQASVIERLYAAHY